MVASSTLCALMRIAEAIVISIAPHDIRLSMALKGKYKTWIGCNIFIALRI